MTTTIYPVHIHKNQEPLIDAVTYETWYKTSIHSPELFWGKGAEENLHWFSSWEKVLEGSFDLLDMNWFVGGKLNASYNCLDRHLPDRADQIAIIWQGDDPQESSQLTYKELHEQVSRFANVLLKYKVKKGDKVCIYLPMIPEAIIAMLACARIGAVHSVVFAGFSSSALKTRIQDADCKMVITANVSLRNKKIIPLKENVDVALKDYPAVTEVIVVARNEMQVPWQDDRDLWYHELMRSASADSQPAIMDSADPLFILYTSGSTGKPKGILHVTGGYLVYAAITFKYIFDYHEREIFWCSADVGWVTGHTYTVYGPLLNGATLLIYEGVPNYPTASRYWQIIDKFQVNIFYTSPTAIRALRREGDEWVKKTARQSLRLLGSVGEPINPDAWQWFYEVIGDHHCPIVDTWWQTETGGIMISAFPGATPLKAGSAAWPFFGIVPAIVDDKGNPVGPNVMGNLIIKQPWPGLMKTIYGDHERFEKYFSRFTANYETGDLAYQDEDGYFWIQGRSDDVIKVSGHRIGTQEVESALIHHPDVSETAVVAVPDDIKGQSIYAFVTLKANVVPTHELEKQLKQTVREIIGPIAVPQTIQWADNLPKTRSGKIMRRLLRKIANHDVDNLGDLSTLSDPEVIDKLIEKK